MEIIDWFGIPYIYSDHDPKRNSWHITNTNNNRLMEDIKIENKMTDGIYHHQHLIRRMS